MTTETETNPVQRPSFVRRVWRAFKNFAIVFSFIVNFVLVALLITIALQSDAIFTVKSEVAEPMLMDLDQAFAALGDTTIQTTVYITDTVPVVFGLPLNENTNVVLTQPVPVSVPAQFALPGGGGMINGTVSLNLPQGQVLPVSLAFNVPVSTTLPIVMQVPVQIPLSEAGMGPAIEQLRAVFRPMTSFIQSLPDNTEEMLHPDE